MTRVSALVDGEELFYESVDIGLLPQPEVFASALLQVAVASGVPLTVDSPLDPVWRRNVETVLRIWSSWWGTPAEAKQVVSGPSTRSAPAEKPSASVGLCFTLGVDSFYTLLRSGRKVDRLIFTEGYDVPLGDHERMRPIHAAIRDVARNLDVAPTIVRTNLRRHHVGRRMDWERGHGGALAAVGHACSGDLAELLISATKPVFANRPWGSHWETDPAWSSSRLRVTHIGAERRRNDKLAALLDEPLAQRHLRVCWENRTPSGNCGECEKCVRTMLILAVNGRLADFRTFPQDGSVASRLDGVTRIPPDTIPVYETALKRCGDLQTRRAIERLIERSSGLRSRLSRGLARVRPILRR